MPNNKRKYGELIGQLSCIFSSEEKKVPHSTSHVSYEFAGPIDFTGTHPIGCYQLTDGKNDTDLATMTSHFRFKGYKLSDNRPIEKCNFEAGKTIGKNAAKRGAKKREKFINKSDEYIQGYHIGYDSISLPPEVKEFRLGKLVGKNACRKAFEKRSVFYNKSPEYIAGYHQGYDEETKKNHFGRYTWMKFHKQSISKVVSENNSSNMPEIEPDSLKLKS